MPRHVATDTPSAEFSAAEIRQQLDLLIQDPAFRSSKRSVQFLSYVVEQTLKGSADQIKERTIGVEVFGREPSYDTNVDHVVRTAAVELRKRLATYYDAERHRSELRMSLVPGSYIPRFSPPTQVPHASESDPDLAHFSFQIAPPAADTEAHQHVVPVLSASPPVRSHKLLAVGLVVVLSILGATFAYSRLQGRDAQYLFWKPVFDTPGTVLLAVGSVANGPPKPSGAEPGASILTVPKTSSPTVPFADAVTLARVLGVLESHNKKVMIRAGGSSSFSDLREGPVVLIGAFNNEWSVRRRAGYATLFLLTTANT
jgi:hypothetical protein